MDPVHTRYTAMASTNVLRLCVHPTVQEKPVELTVAADRADSVAVANTAPPRRRVCQMHAHPAATARSVVQLTAAVVYVSVQCQTVNMH